MQVGVESIAIFLGQFSNCFKFWIKITGALQQFNIDLKVQTGTGFGKSRRKRT